MDTIIRDDVEFSVGENVIVRDGARRGFIIRSHFRPDAPDNDLRKVYCVGFDMHWSMEYEFFYAEDLVAG